MYEKVSIKIVFEANSSLSLIAAVRKNPQAQSTFEYSQLIGIEATAVASGYIGQFEFVLHGDASGKVYKQEEGNNFGGEEIFSVYQTPYLFMEDPEVRKIFYKITTFLKTEGEAEIDVGINFNYGDSEILVPTDFRVTTAGAAAFFNDSGTLFDDTDIYDGNPSPTRSTTINGSGDSMSISYVTNSTSPSHTIQAFTISYGIGETGDKKWQVIQGNPHQILQHKLLLELILLMQNTMPLGMLLVNHRVINMMVQQQKVHMYH